MTAMTTSLKEAKREWAGPGLFVPLNPVNTHRQFLSAACMAMV